MLIWESTESAASTDMTSNRNFFPENGVLFLHNTVNFGFPYHINRLSNGKGAPEMAHFFVHKHFKIITALDETPPWRGNSTLRSIWLPENGVSEGLKDRDGLVGEKTLDAVSCHLPMIELSSLALKYCLTRRETIISRAIVLSILTSSQQGFDTGILARSMHISGSPTLVRYKMRGSDRAVHDFRKSKNHYRRQKYAFQHLKSSCKLSLLYLYRLGTQYMIILCQKL
jgi:hypothetical protein